MTNIDDDTPIIDSPLNRTVSRKGKSVEVEVYRAEKEVWILKAVDEHGNSTVWDGRFPTDQPALYEAMRSIDEQGIDAVIVPTPGQDKRNPTMQGLSDAELCELDDFLAAESNELTSMNLAMLDGYLAAIAIGPGLIPPSTWLLWVWDHVYGRTQPVFNKNEQASRIVSLPRRATLPSTTGQPMSAAECCVPGASTARWPRVLVSISLSMSVLNQSSYSIAME